MAVGVLVVGELSDAKRLAKALAAGNAVEGATLEGMTLIDLDTLADLLVPGTQLLDGAERVGHGAAVPIPPRLSEKLRKLKPAAIERLAKTWADSEEFRGLLEPPELAIFLTNAARIAREAHAKNAALLFLNL